ncbi:MAG: tyrosine-protein phosphatase [Prevotella sp.]|nr:tyrosine-protein phosphatase [Prevotella sp.]
MKVNNDFSAAIILLAMTFSAQVAHSQRAIEFNGIENARDMGTLVMQNGQTVRMGMLVRSGNLSKVTDGDVAVLKEKYRLTDVFDFRFEAEANAAPDRTIDGVSYTHLSTLPQAFISMSPKLGDDRGLNEGISNAGSDPQPPNLGGLGNDMLAVLMKYAFDPQAQTMARRLYPAIVTDSTAQRYYGTFLRGVLRAEGGVLWHCSQGKDRAGWASAFLLAALGASRETIVKDFDLSNQSYAPQVEALTAKVLSKREKSDARIGSSKREAAQPEAKVQGKDGSDEAVSFIRAMVGVSRENFEATLDLIDQRYGSLSAYIENQLGFSREEQQQLRIKYLE